MAGINLLCVQWSLLVEAGGTEAESDGAVPGGTRMK